MNECIQRFLILINYYKINIYQIANKIINYININKNQKFYIFKYLYEIYRDNILKCSQVSMLHQFIGIYYLYSPSYTYYKVNDDIYCEFRCNYYNYIYLLLFFILIKYELLDKKYNNVLKMSINPNKYKIVITFKSFPFKMLDFSENQPWKWIYLNCKDYPYKNIPPIIIKHHPIDLYITIENIIYTNNLNINSCITDWYLYFYSNTSWDSDELEYIYYKWKENIIKNKKLFIYKYFYLLSKKRLKIINKNSISKLYYQLSNLDKFIVLNILEYY